MKILDSSLRRIVTLGIALCIALNVAIPCLGFDTTTCNGAFSAAQQAQATVFNPLALTDMSSRLIGVLFSQAMPFVGSMSGTKDAPKQQPGKSTKAHSQDFCFNETHHYRKLALAVPVQETYTDTLSAFYRIESVQAENARELPMSNVLHVCHVLSLCTSLLPRGDTGSYVSLAFIQISKPTCFKLVFLLAGKNQQEA